jgi:hypothetical protein
MPDWLLSYLGYVQGGIIKTLAGQFCRFDPQLRIWGSGIRIPSGAPLSWRRRSSKTMFRTLPRLRFHKCQRLASSAPSHSLRLSKQARQFTWLTGPNRPYLIATRRIPPRPAEVLFPRLPMPKSASLCITRRCDRNCHCRILRKPVTVAADESKPPPTR